MNFSAIPGGVFVVLRAVIRDCQDVLHCRGTGCSMRESMRGAMWKTRRWVVGRLGRRVHYGMSVKEVRRGVVAGTKCVGDENVIFVFKTTFV